MTDVVAETSGTICVEVRPGYRVVTLNRPARLNAFNVAMHKELMSALDEAERDPACRALILTGAGRGFCAGQDLADRLTDDGSPPDLGGSLARHYNPLVRRLRSLRFPVIAAVNGVAAGAGANIALACDIVVASRQASFLQTFTNLGLIPDCGGTWMLPRLVGAGRARAIALLGEPIAAEQAAEWGLIWKCCDGDDLLREARSIATRLAAKPPFGVALTKQALEASADSDLAGHLDVECELQRRAGRDPDYVARVRAFFEKRGGASQ
jgi:2-(1,2-epoxy-1,2-dihydrophenyl)acetyl-CoA isomerase